MLSRISNPGLFITGTDTGVGKTVIAGALARYFRRRGARVGVCKPIATGCPHRREGLVSEDAEFLAFHADARFPLDVICPQRFAEPLAPAVAAERAGQAIDWAGIDAALQMMARQSQVMVVEGVGGVMVPLDRRTLVLDMIRQLDLPVVIVARAGLGTINHTLLTAAALRSAGAVIAGVVINEYPPETPGAAEETNPGAIERWGKLPVLCMTPKHAGAIAPHLPEDLMAAIDSVAWEEKATRV